MIICPILLISSLKKYMVTELGEIVFGYWGLNMLVKQRVELTLDLK